MQQTTPNGLDAMNLTVLGSSASEDNIILLCKMRLYSNILSLLIRGVFF